MRLYKTTAIRAELAKNADGTSSQEVQVRWAGSQAEAATNRKTFVGMGFKRAEVNTVEVEVPTNKAGLLDFLNDFGHALV